MDYTKDEILRIINTLIGGSIRPVADSRYDADALERAKLLIEVMKHLHLYIGQCATDFQNSPFASCKEVGQECAKYLKWLGIPE